MLQSMEMAVWIDKNPVTFYRDSFRTDMTVSQTIEKASGEI